MKYLLYLFLFTFILSAQETFAQDASEYGLEEIVVTAQKREDSIQTVPIAITAIDGDVLDNKAVVNLESLQYNRWCC